MSSMNYNNTNYNANNQLRYDFFGRYSKGIALKLRWMGGMKLEYGAKLLAIMIILSVVRIPIAEVEAVKANPLWSGFCVLLIAWCIFWLLDGFVGHFFAGFLAGYQGSWRFSGGVIFYFFEGIKEKGFKKTRLGLLRDISFEIYLRKHPSFRKKADNLRREYRDKLSYISYSEKNMADYNRACSALYASEGIYLKDGWKVCSSKKR